MNTSDLPIGRSIVAAFMLVSSTAQAQEGGWAATSLVAAPSARTLHTAVWTGSRMIVWGGSGRYYSTKTGATYDPTTDTWTPTSTANAPSARDTHTAVSTGARMIVWGGFGGGGNLNSGAVYDPASDTWTPTSLANAPSARDGHTAVWTGSRMIVWGGYGASSYLNTGAAYDPTTDTWTSMSTVDAPGARAGHGAVWTGSRMIVWGGYGGDSYLNTGAMYDPTTDTWAPTSTAGAPSAREGHTAVWTGSRVIVWGGYTHDGSMHRLDTGAAYDPTTDTWTPTSTVGAPGAREGHTAVSTRSRMIVWGGYGGGGNLNTGAVYDPTTDTWTPTSTAGAPAARVLHTAVWTGLRMIAWGGSGGAALDSGGSYDPLLAQSFHTVMPCRLVDTRLAPGPLGGPALAANTSRAFVVAGECGIPLTAQALSVNLTATEQTAQGHLRLYPGGTTPPNSSSLNYPAGQTRANNAVVTLGALGDVGVQCVQGTGTAHVVIDVNGYFE